MTAAQVRARIALLALGTRGDVQPTAVLAAALAARGHTVTLVAPDDLVPIGTALGLRTLGAGFSVRSFLASPAGRAFLASGSPLGYLRAVVAEKERVRVPLLAAFLDACAGADVVVANNLVLDEAALVAGAVGARVAGLQFAPRSGDPAYPSVLVTARRLPRTLNRLTHVTADLVEQRVARRYLARVRDGLGLPRERRSPRAGLRAQRTLELQAYGAALVPALRGSPAHRPVTGFLRPAPDQHARWGDDPVDGELDAWLRAGDPPVYFGFGSMPLDDPAAVVATVRAVCRELGVRGLVGAAWSGLVAEGDDDLRVVGTVDHTALLPRCRAAVHHGGAGTTGASVGAGVPTVVAALAFDQPFWGERLREAGAGTWFPLRDLDRNTLVRALREVLTEATGVRARALAGRLAAEDGVAAAVERVEDLVAAGSGRPPGGTVTAPR